jgi:hypothetical protein
MTWWATCKQKNFSGPPLATGHCRSRRNPPIWTPYGEYSYTGVARSAAPQRGVGHPGADSQHGSDTTSPASINNIRCKRGALVKQDWFAEYETDQLPGAQLGAAELDTANKDSELAHFNVCTTWGIQESKIYLLRAESA